MPPKKKKARICGPKYMTYSDWARSGTRRVWLLLLPSMEVPLMLKLAQCVGLADAIERDDLAAQQALCERYVAALRQHAPGDMDTVVLGCTHYPFAASVLTQLLGANVALIDTGEAVARRTRDVLNLSTTKDTDTTPPVLLSTGDPAALSLAAQRWLGVPTRAEKLVA